MSERRAGDGLIITKQYRLFAEFCDACMRYRYIGLCHGAPGVGKTASARHFARWDLIAPYLDEHHPVKPEDDFRPPAELLDCHSLFYTPAVTNTPLRVSAHVGRMYASHRISNYYAGYTAKREQIPERYMPFNWPQATKLLIVDEADRLKMPPLEALRDFYDRQNVALILIGMPGIEKRMARYPQLYSRVGFVHEFKAMGEEELQFMLKQKWQHLSLSMRPDDFTDAEAMASVVRITGGNFRLLQRLLAQVERTLEINGLKVITREVVETARDSLVIGNA